MRVGMQQPRNISLARRSGRRSGTQVTVRLQLETTFDGRSDKFLVWFIYRCTFQRFNEFASDTRGSAKSGRHSRVTVRDVAPQVVHKSMCF